MKIEIDKTYPNIVLIRFINTILNFDMSTNGGYKILSRIIVALDSLVSGGAAVRTIELQYSKGYLHTLTLSKDCGGTISYYLEKRLMIATERWAESGTIYDAARIVEEWREILLSFTQSVKEVVE